MSPIRRYAPPVAAALLAGGALYGLLAAVRPASADEDDPWLKAWTAAGLHAQFRGTSAEPAKNLQLVQQRERFARPEFAGTRIRLYVIHGFRAQVVELPSERLRAVTDDLLEDEGEGPHHSQGTEGSNHYCQAGRHLLILSNQQRLVFWKTRLPEETRQKAELAFQETAKRLAR